MVARAVHVHHSTEMGGLIVYGNQLNCIAIRVFQEKSAPPDPGEVFYSRFDILFCKPLFSRVLLRSRNGKRYMVEGGSGLVSSGYNLLFRSGIKKSENGRQSAETIADTEELYGSTRSGRKVFQSQAITVEPDHRGHVACMDGNLTETLDLKSRLHRQTFQFAWDCSIKSVINIRCNPRGIS